MRIQVKDIMNSPVATCKAEADVARVRMKMDEMGYGAMPITQEENGREVLKGIVTIKDLAGLYDNISVKQVMKEKVTIVHPESSAQAAAQLMVKKQIHHLVVMKEGDILGMLSSADFVRLVAKYQLSD